MLSSKLESLIKSITKHMELVHGSSPIVIKHKTIDEI